MRPLAFTLCALLAAPAFADDLALAKQHFQQGQKLYDVGEFEKARIEYAAAYDAKPLPAFLFNMAQCYMEMKDYERAAFNYSRFLDKAPSDPNTALVRERLKDAEVQLKTQQEAERLRLDEEQHQRAEEEQRQREQAEKTRAQSGVTPAASASSVAATRAVFVNAGDKIEVGFLDEIRFAFDDLGERFPQLALLSRNELRRRLGKEYAEKAEACHRALPCLAELARQLGVQELVYARINNDGVLHAIVVDGSSGRALRASRFAVDQTTTPGDVVALHTAEIFNVNIDGQLELPGHTGAIESDGLVIGEGPGPHVLAAGEHIVRFGDEERKVAVLPGKTTTLAIGPAPTAVMPEPAVAIAPLPSATAGEPVSWLGYGGIATTGAGAVLMGFGAFNAYQWWQLDQEVKAIANNEKSLDQVDAPEKNRQVSRAFRLGRGLLAGGTAVALLGAGILAADVLWSGENATAHVSTDGASVTLGVSW